MFDDNIGEVFEYNGFKVQAIGRIERIPGGQIQRVRVIDPPHWLIDREFNAVITTKGR